MRKLLTLVLFLAAPLGVAPLASADPVTVLTPPNSSCVIAGFGGSYSGFSTVVLTDSGITLFQCHGSLVSGTAVATRQMVKTASCTIVFSPGGVANSVCSRL